MIPQIEPWINEDDAKEVYDSVKSSWVTEAHKTKEFEDNFKKITKTKNAIAFCNGTATLFTAMKVLGIGQGDEVLAPDLTFTASINSIIMTGATPVIVDLEKNTFNIDPKKIEEKINGKTKAIMPVHLYGQSADMEKIMEIAKKHNLYVIEDAAQGVGVKFGDKYVGTFGDFGSFSFYGNKTITTGEGGMLITNDPNLAETAYQFKNHGRKEKGVFIHETIGFNFSISEMQSALGVSQLKRLDQIIENKKKIRDFYFSNLSNIEGIKFMDIDERCSPVFWFTNILVEDPEKLAEKLKEKDIQTRRFFYPIHKQPCYNFKEEFPNSLYLYDHGLSLPSSATLKKEDLQKVCEEIKKIMKK